MSNEPESKPDDFWPWKRITAPMPPTPGDGIDRAEGSVGWAWFAIGALIGLLLLAVSR